MKIGSKRTLKNSNDFNWNFQFGKFNKFSKREKITQKKILFSKIFGKHTPK